MFDEDGVLELDFFYDYDPIDGDREWYMADIDLYYTFNKVYFPALSESIDDRRKLVYIYSTPHTCHCKYAINRHFV